MRICYIFIVDHHLVFSGRLIEPVVVIKRLALPK